jgi:hypothetical protein
VLFDGLVRRLASDTSSDRRHEYLGRSEEGQVAIEFTLHDRGERPELVQDRQESLEEPIDGEERISKGHSTHHRARDVSLVPLVPRQLAEHRCVAAQDHGEAIHALAGARVHLVWHRRRANLSRLESFGDELVPSHEPDGRRE